MNIFTSGLVHVIVGPEATAFDVHRSLICERCPFFERAICGGFREAKTKTVELPDDDPEAFAEFLSWMYFNKIFENNAKPKWIQLGKLWILADKFRVRTLQNTVMNLLMEKYKQKKTQGGGIRISTPTLEHLYDRTGPGSLLRKLMVTILAGEMTSSELKSRAETLPVELLQDLCLCLRRGIEDAFKNDRVTLPFRPTAEAYYAHDADETGNATQEVVLSKMPFVHEGITCDGPICALPGRSKYIVGIRYHCSVCEDTDFCSDCYASPSNGHDRSHTIVEIKEPIAIHHGIFCDGHRCEYGNTSIEGPRYKCSVCANKDFCHNCRVWHDADHDLILVKRPGPVLTPQWMVSLTEAQRKQRKREGRCVNCDEPGHLLIHCEGDFQPPASPPPED